MITIKKASPSDVAVIVEYIAKKAAFDRELGCYDGQIATTSERIDKALFGVPVFAYAMLAVRDCDNVGFAFYHYHFSSFQARPSLWLDDLYVDAIARRSGAGIALMGALATEAASHDCTHIGWVAAGNNYSGIPFYTKIGARPISRQDSGYTYSITPESLLNRITQIDPPNKPPLRTLTIGPSSPMIAQSNPRPHSG